MEDVNLQTQCTTFRFVTVKHLAGTEPW